MGTQIAARGEKAIRTFIRAALIVLATMVVEPCAVWNAGALSCEVVRHASASGAGRGAPPDASMSDRLLYQGLRQADLRYKQKRPAATRLHRGRVQTSLYAKRHGGISRKPDVDRFFLTILVIYGSTARR